MLKIQKFLRDLGKRNRSIGHHILTSEFGINIYKKPLYTGNRSVLEYVWLYESDFDSLSHPITKECSSLILDENFFIVSKLPPKIPFLAEESAPPLDWSNVKGHLIHDGVVLSIFKHKNQLCFHTYNDVNGQTHVENRPFQLCTIKALAHNVLKYNLGAETHYAFNTNHCVICKLIKRKLPDSAGNLFLLEMLDVIDKISGKSEKQFMIDRLANALEMKTSMPLKVRSAIDAIYLVNSSSGSVPDVKGIVLNDIHGNKVKIEDSTRYNPRHVFNEQKGFPFRGLAEIVLRKDLHAYIQNAPEYKRILLFMHRELKDILMEAEIFWQKIEGLPNKDKDEKIKDHQLSYLFYKLDKNIFQGFFHKGKKLLDVDIFLSALNKRNPAAFNSEIDKLVSMFHEKTD